MVYDHVVKMNGEYYSAGTDVPEQEEASILPFSDSDIELGNRTGKTRKA